MEECLSQVEVVWISLVISAPVVLFYHFFLISIPKKVAFKRAGMHLEIGAIKEMLADLQKKKVVIVTLFKSHPEVVSKNCFNAKNILSEIEKTGQEYLKFSNKPVSYYAGKNLRTFFRLVYLESKVCFLKEEVDNVQNFIDNFQKLIPKK